MTRALTTAVANAVAGTQGMGLVMLVELVLDTGTVRIASTPYDVIAFSATYTGVGGLGSSDQITESESGEVTGLRLMLSGVPSSAIALALGEIYQGRVVKIYSAFTQSPSHAILADPVLEWAGKLDQMMIEDAGNGESTLTVTAENELFDFERPIATYYSNEDQQKLYSGDRGFEYAAALANRLIVWPSAAYYQR